VKGLEPVMKEITYALRTLRRSPSFAITAVLTLAIGIAANTIAFTLLNSLALRPMPVRDPERVVKIFPIDSRGHRQNLFSYQDFLDFQLESQGFEGLAAYIPTSVTVQIGHGDAEDVVAYAVTPEYFPLLGIQPSLGRTFGRSDEERASAVAIISHRLWERRFASDANILGGSININGRLFTIVGVGPARFAGTEPLAPDVWVPTATQPTVIPGPALLPDRAKPWLLVVGRLRPGITRDAAATALTLTARRLSLAYPAPTREVAVTVVRGTFFTIDPPLWPIIFLVLSVVAMVLAIACANVANLVLARATVQQREVAIRLAIGSSRWRVARQLIAETLLVSLAGGGVGLLMTTWVLSALYPLGMSVVPFEWGSVVLDVSPDLRVFAYTFGIAAAAGVLLGLIPAVQTSSPQLSSALHDNAVLVGTRLTRSRLRDGLVVLQVAMCLALLTAAGLLGRALQRAHALDLGFDVDHVVFTEYDLRRGGYSPTAGAEYNRSLLEIARGDNAALTSHVPLHGGIVRAAIRPEGLSEVVTCTRTSVSASYFRVLGISVTAGRSFSVAEADQPSPVAVISEGLAARFWPRINPLGRRLSVEGLPVPFTVIGIVRDTSNSSLWREKEMAVYIPAGYADPRDLHVMARADGDLAVLANALGARARSLDARITFRATSLETLLQLWILPSRVASVAAGVLGVLALALASIGLYGVLGYTVAHRTREIGIRIALGATRADVMRLILGNGARLVAVGTATGMVGAFALGALLHRFLFDLGALDPVTFVLVPSFLGAVSLVACYLPARRAARIAPLAALRAE
jgi:putative ABC transport system permease protein